MIIKKRESGRTVITELAERTTVEGNDAALEYLA
jgi:hypothetical protein